MKKVSVLLLLALFFILFSCSKESLIEYHTDVNGYNYETYSNDPVGVRVYALENGLKVYLTQNYDEPRVASSIAVKAGSAYDPENSTGLAHYLEHLLFNGNDKIGALDWGKEKQLLNEISDLYEDHRATYDEGQKKEILKKIDNLSYEASKISIVSEYNNLFKLMGGTLKNGITNFDQTMYYNLVSKGSLERFLTLEAERFGNFVPRSFQNELEIVYEEFNTIQGQTWKKKFYALNRELFKKHPYKNQGIGSSEHLKNPSIKAIQKYFDTYYVPNNMAVMLTGDLEFEKTIQLVDKTFGRLKKKEGFKSPALPKEDPITEIIETELIDASEESVYLGFRYDGAKSEEEKFVTIVDMLLANGKAGLFDIELKAKQQVKDAKSNVEKMVDYGVHYMDGYPLKGQTLKEVESLMLAQIEKIKKGDFEDWLLKAVINDLRIRDAKEFESKWIASGPIYKSFVEGKSWGERMSYVDDLEKITKQQIVEFTNNFYRDNYAVLYKRIGEANSINVQKPEITPLAETNEKESDFAKHLNMIQSEKVAPKFLDFEKEIIYHQLNNKIKMAQIKNENSLRFELDFIFEIGSDHNKILPVAMEFIKYLGTTKFSVDNLNQEYYKNGISSWSYINNDRTVFHIEGLNKNMKEGVKLLNHFLDNLTSDETTFNQFIEGYVKKRKDNKLNRRSIRRGLINYALYGEKSRFSNVLSDEELNQLTSEDLISQIKELKAYKQEVLFVGDDVNKALTILKDEYKTIDSSKEAKKIATYEKKKSDSKVYFVDYDMVQVELTLISRGPMINKGNLPFSNLLNFYLGNVNQEEIRVKRSLAYSTFSVYRDASRLNDYDYFEMYLGTQANKSNEAVSLMADIVNKLPRSNNKFKITKEDLLNRFETSRTVKGDVYWYSKSLEKIGVDYDIFADKYQKIKTLTLDDIEKFYYQSIKNNKYDILVIGSKKSVDFKHLAKYGKVVELNKKQLFGY